MNLDTLIIVCLIKKVKKPEIRDAPIINTILKKRTSLSSSGEILLRLR